ncbi:hypothetical protein EMCRGX_G024356 [Ephydatia muelleri]|eukprot:Em0015g544a
MKVQFEISRPCALLYSTQDHLKIEPILRTCLAPIYGIGVEMEKDCISFPRTLHCSQNAVENFTCDRDVIFLIFTSGSTGVPKAACASASVTLNRFEWMWNEFPFQCNDVVCFKTSVNFVDCIWELLGTVLKGACLAIPLEEEAKDPRLLVEFMKKWKVTRVMFVPSYLRHVLEFTAASESLQFLTHCLSSGEPVTLSLAAMFFKAAPSCRFLNLYGTSEIWDVTYFEVTSQYLEKTSSSSVPIGKPIPNVDVQVIDPNTGEVISPNSSKEGELVTFDTCAAHLYLNSNDKSLAHPDSKRIFNTHDLVYYNSVGDLMYIGRRDHQVKVSNTSLRKGGNSLSAVELASGIMETLHCSIPVSTIITSPTIQALAFAIDSEVAKHFMISACSDDNLDASIIDATGPLTFGLLVAIYALNGLQDIVAIIPNASRNPENMKISGLFDNCLPLRTEFGSTVNLHLLLQTVKEVFVIALMTATAKLNGEFSFLPSLTKVVEIVEGCANDTSIVVMDIRDQEHLLKSFPQANQSTVGLLLHGVSVDVFTIEYLDSFIQSVSKSGADLLVIPEITVPLILPKIVEHKLSIKHLWIQGLPLGLAYISNWMAASQHMQVIVTHSLMHERHLITHHLNLKDIPSIEDGSIPCIPIGRMCQGLNGKVLHRDGREVYQGFVGNFATVNDSQVHHSTYLVRQLPKDGTFELVSVNAEAYYKAIDVTPALFILSTIPEVSWCGVSQGIDKESTAILYSTPDVESSRHKIRETVLSYLSLSYLGIIYPLAINLPITPDFTLDLGKLSFSGHNSLLGPPMFSGHDADKDVDKIVRSVSKAFGIDSETVRQTSDFLVVGAMSTANILTLTVELNTEFNGGYIVSDVYQAVKDGRLIDLVRSRRQK